MLKYWKTIGTFSPDVRRFLMSWALVGFSYFGIQGVLFNLYLLRLGYGPEFLGLFIAAGQVSWALMALPAARIGRRIGLHASIRVAFLLSAVCLALLLLVEMLPPFLWSAWLVGWWLVLWAAAALNTVNSTPYLMAVATDAERNHAFSAQAALMALTGFAGSVLAGLLPSVVAGWLGTSLETAAPYWSILWLAPITYLIIFILWMQSPPVYLEVTNAHGEATARPPLALFFLYGMVTLLFAVNEGAVRAFFNVYLDVELQIAASQIGVMIGVGQFIPVAAALILPALLARWGTAGTLVFAALGAAVALLTLSALPLWPVAAAGFIGVLSTNALSGPARNMWGQELVAPRWRTTISAVGTIGLALGSAVAAAAGGYLARFIGLRGVFALTAIVALFVVLLLVAFLRQRKAASLNALVEEVAPS